MAKILVVDDDAELRAALEDWLQCENYLFDVAADGKQAVELIDRFAYDLIVLDWELPELDGINVLRHYRGRGGMSPVIMLTGKGSLADKEIGFENGADDYLPKPFHLKELSVRVKALMRRPAVYVGNALTVRHLSLDPVAHTVSSNGKPIELLPKEYAILELFMRHPGQLFTAEAILDKVWHSESESGEETVYTWIKRLRVKVDTDKSKPLIKNVYGAGYRMDAQ